MEPEDQGRLLLTEAEVIRWTGISRNSLATYRKLRLGPPARRLPGGKGLRYIRCEVVEWARSLPLADRAAGSQDAGDE